MKAPGFILLVVLASAPLTACSFGPVWARHTEGRVVDAATQEPVAGATVYVSYRMSAVGIEPVRGVLGTRWAVTDSDGRFAIPGRVMIEFVPLGSVDTALTFTVFHPYYAVWNEATPDASGHYAIEPDELGLDTLLDGRSALSICHDLDRAACRHLCRTAYGELAPCS